MTEPAPAEPRPDRAVSSADGWVERHEVKLVWVACGLAALPSLIWIFAGVGFLSDDWWSWLAFHDLGLGGGLRLLAFESPARPLVAPYYAVLFVGIGHVPVVHALLLAIINAAAVYWLWRAGRGLVPTSMLVPALIVFATLPNRSTTHLWFVTGNYPLAMLIAMAGFVAFRRNRIVRASVAMLIATLLFEGAVFVGLSAVCLFTLQDFRSRIRGACVVIGVAAAAALYMFFQSPKLSDNPTDGRFDQVDTFFAGQLGVGVWGVGWLSRVAGLVVLAGVVVSIITLLPSFRRADPHLLWIRVASAMALGGALPFMIAGSAFATGGLFDRNNMMASVGIALLIGVEVAALTRLNAPVGRGLLVVMVLWFGVLTMGDIGVFSRAVRDGERLVREFPAELGEESSPLLVYPITPDHDTVKDFLNQSDLIGALTYRYGGDWSFVRTIDSLPCGTLLEFDSVRVYDWRTRTVSTVSGMEAGALCSSELD